MIDASALLRGLEGDGTAAEIVDAIARGETVAHAPDLLTPELGNAVVRLVRAGERSPDEADAIVEVAAALPLARHPTTELAQAALAMALASGLSAYDAHYACLAEAAALPLVTADRRLARAVRDGLLVS